MVDAGAGRVAGPIADQIGCWVAHLIAYLIAYLIAQSVACLIADRVAEWVVGVLRLDCFLHGGEQCLKHEGHERGGVGGPVGCGQGAVVGVLAVSHQGLDRQIGQERAPAAQDQGLPESAQTAVAVAKGVYEYEFVVTDTACHQGDDFAAGEPVQQVPDQDRDPAGGRGHVDQRGAAVDADTAAAQAPGVVHQAGHQQSVGGQQVAQGCRVPGRQSLIGGQGVADLLDLARQAQDALAVEDGADLIDGEAVVLDGERRLDGADAVVPAQTR